MRCSPVWRRWSRRMGWRTRWGFWPAGGVRMYVLTNSIFRPLSGAPAAGARDRPLFEAVFASADIGWRKPARAFSSMGSDGAAGQSRSPRRDLVFVGNDLAADIRGGLAVGLRTVVQRGGRPAPPTFRRGDRVDAGAARHPIEQPRAKAPGGFVPVFEKPVRLTCSRSRSSCRRPWAGRTRPRGSTSS